MFPLHKQGILLFYLATFYELIFVTHKRTFSEQEYLLWILLQTCDPYVKSQTFFDMLLISD